MKVNVDGSLSVAGGVTGCSGVLRDWDGSWKGGFSYNIGCCSVDEAEAWAVIQGLRMALSLGVTKIIVESDSKVTIDRLHNHNGLHGNISNLIHRCLAVLCDFEEFRINHVYREQNGVADLLAKRALNQPPGVFLFDEAPCDLRKKLYED